jgi:hypothetical protein
MNRYRSELLELHKNPEPLTYEPVRKRDIKPTDAEIRRKADEEYKMGLSSAKAYGDIVR